MYHSNKVSEQFYNAIAYYRLSKEDKRKNESDSIANQRKLILNYLSDYPNITLVDEAYDDGYTGTNFNRPGFKSVIQSLKDGKADCIIVKDLSRLGREYIETGKYIEMTFPEMNVRFIAINDDVDTVNPSAGDDVMIPFKNLMNETYCRELSLKLRKQFKVQRDSGEFISNFAAYGYRRDPKDKHKLIVDEYAASIVRGIFDLSIKGFSPERIAEHLNKMGIMAPYEYKRKDSNYSSGFKGAGESVWNHMTVRRILTNTVYIGELAQGKRTTPSFKIKKVRHLSREQWSIVENNHEPIIEKEIFYTVQKILMRDMRISTSAQMLQPLAGVLFCGDCGSPMWRRTVKRCEKSFYYYSCGGFKKKSGCTIHNISQPALEKAVLGSINKQIELMIELDAFMKQIDTGEIRSLKLKRVDILLTEKEEEREKYLGHSTKLYDSYVDELITRDDYRMMKEKYSVKIKECEESIRELEKRRKAILEETSGSHSWIHQFLKYKDMQELTHEAVVIMIDRIDIFEDKRIQITFNYKNEFKDLISTIEEVQGGGSLLWQEKAELCLA